MKGGENMMTIKDKDEWTGIENLCDISGSGINPLIALTKIVDSQFDEHDLDGTGNLLALNRTLYLGLQDVETALEKL